MKIAFPLINLSSHGGVRVLIELGNELASRGADVEFIVPLGRVTARSRLNPSVPVREIGFGTGSKAIDYLLFLLVLPLQLRGKLAIANFFVTFFPVFIASALFQTRYFYYVQDLEDKYQGARRVLNRVCRLSYRSRRMIAANEFIGRRLKLDYSAEVLASYHLGPSASFFLPPVSSEKRYDVMVMVRREPWKGLDRLLQWLELGTARYRVLCVGQEPTLLEELAARGLATARPENDEELRALYDASSVFFFTSHREGFGLPPLEAMARNVPCVLYANGGSDLYVHDGVNAVYVDDTLSAQFAIERLLSDTFFRKELIRNGADTARSLRLSDALSAFADRILLDARTPLQDAAIGDRTGRGK